MLKSNVGYSNLKDAYEAGVETAKMATGTLRPKIGLLFNSTSYDQKKLIEGIKSIMSNVDIIGCTSSLGLITPAGCMIDETGSASMLTFDDDHLVVPCYGMEKRKSARITGREIATKILEKAGLDYAPDYFFISASFGEEEEYIKGIQDIIGRVPCFGGSAADNQLKGDWSLFYNDEIFYDGAVAAFFYTPKTIDTIYTSSYKETKDMGIITKLKNTRILSEIDGIPAIEKYKQWRNLTDKEVKGENLYVTALESPLGIKDRLGNLTAIRQIIKGNKDKSIELGSNLAVGTAVIRMESSVDDIINSIVDTFKELKKKCSTASSYLLICSSGLRLRMGDKIDEVYKQIKKHSEDVPFLVVFTFGEYGYTDDQTNTTGGLMLSFTAFEE